MHQSSIFRNVRCNYKASGKTWVHFLNDATSVLDSSPKVNGEERLLSVQSEEGTSGINRSSLDEEQALSSSVFFCLEYECNEI